MKLYLNSPSNIQYYMQIKSFNQCKGLRTVSFSGKDWHFFYNCITESENIDDFIKNGENSRICSEIPILKDTFSYRGAFGNTLTVGAHTVKVVDYLVKSKEFKSLNSEDKKFMLMLALLHDTGKNEVTVKRADFEALNNNDFVQLVKGKMKNYKIFNSPDEYIGKIKTYFVQNPSVSDCVLHNNTHSLKSEKLASEFLAENHAPSAFSGKLCFLIKEHQFIGQNIEKYLKGIISIQEYRKTPEIIASIINNINDLKLLKIFHIADAHGVRADGAVSKEFLNRLDNICSKSKLLIILNKFRSLI